MNKPTHAAGRPFTRLRWLALTALAACATTTPVPPEPQEAPAAPVPTGDPFAVAAEPPPTAAAAGTPAPAEASEGFLPLPTAAELAARPQAPDPMAPADVKQPPADATKSASGLVSKVLKRGTGNEHPTPEDTVAIRHTGWMASGVKFESTVDAAQATDYIVGRSIAGWVEGLALMVVGEKRRFWIPGSLAHGDSPRQFGLPYGPVVYDIELVAIKHPPKAPEVPADLLTPPAEAKRTSTGIAYRFLSRGTGKVHPKPRSVVEVHYSGWSTDGTMFDSSVARGEPTSFPLNGVIRGWTEALQLMVVGDKARVWIPAKLAYGEKPRDGSPAGPLVFDIELLAIKDPGAR